MKAEYLILLIVWFLSLVSILGIGYALGGSPKSFSGENITNGLTLFIAISNVISCFASIGTLLVVAVARNDWLKPKTSEVTLDLKLAVRAWKKPRTQLNLAVYDGMFSVTAAHAEKSDAVKLHLDNLKFHSVNEREQWVQISLLIERYRFYFPSRNSKDIEKLVEIRENLYLDTLRYVHAIDNSGESLTDEISKAICKNSEALNSFETVTEKLMLSLEPGN